MGVSQATVEQFIRSLDPRDMPRYTISEAARYLRQPESTLRAWFCGTTYGSRPFLKHFKPILPPASRDLLSFYDVASAHVLLAMKAKGATTEDIRAIVESLIAEYPDAKYPLLGRDFFMFGTNVVTKQLGQLLNLSRFRQLGIRTVMNRFLSRLDLDEEKMPLRFSPAISPTGRGSKIIVIDPDLAAGRPVVRGTGVAAEIIAKRKDSGESIASLAKDYRLTRRAIEEAIKYFDKSEAA